MDFTAPGAFFCLSDATTGVGLVGSGHSERFGAKPHGRAELQLIWWEAATPDVWSSSFGFG